MRILSTGGRKRNHGFTLIELLVVVVIIAILLAIAIPAYLSQQTKAKDQKAKQYLAYAYRAIRGGIVDTSDQFPRSTSMVSWVQQSEPELTVASGSCYAPMLVTNAVVVDSSSTSSNLLLCDKSDSGNYWKLAATPTSAPQFLDASAVPLTMSGNEITDATRAADVQGDGLTSDSSTGVWDATTNLVTNGGFESGTSGWTSGQTMTQDTSTSKFGAASMKLVTPGFGGAKYVFSGSPSTTYTASLWFKTDAAGAGQTFQFKIDLNDGGLNHIQFETGSTSWQRVTFTLTTASSSPGTFNVALYANVGCTFWIDGVQVEQSAFATPYVETNGATATRGATLVQAPASLLDETQGWVALRLQMGVNSSLTSVVPRAFGWNDTGSNGIQLFYDTSNARWEGRRFTPSSNTNSVYDPATFSAGDLVTVVMAWTATAVKVSVGGAAFQSQANTNIPTLAAARFYIGEDVVAPLNGDVKWFACGTGTLTNTDGSTIDSWGDNDPTVAQFPTAAQADFVWNGVDATGSLK